MVGVDEVGRGCLAGPILVVAARQTATLPEGIRDSKLLSRRQREAILERLTSNVEFGEGWVKAAEIDNLGVASALRLGVKRALSALTADIREVIIMDGKVNYLPKRFRGGVCMVDADNLLPIVSAASIYAKVTRDNFMVKLAQKYPEYSFESHVGYGTKIHLQALDAHGVIKMVHRTSYEPIADLLVAGS